MWLEINDVSKNFDGTPVLQHFACSLESGQIACLLGSSGSGKTTALRAIAGFEPIDRGRITLAGQMLCDQHTSIPAHQRNVGMVFQDHALFPHLTVADNIAFGISGSKAHKQQRVEHLLALIHLPQHAQSYPHQLSGGQQQRVALARSLAPRPKLLLLDEPFSSLDVALRAHLAREVRGILKSEGVTALMVTHDQQEAFAMADVIGVMHQGHIEQWDDPYRLYHEPKTRYVADFIGQGVFLKAMASNTHCIDLELGQYCSQDPHGFAAGQALSVLIRPDDVVHDEGKACSQHFATVKAKVFRGTDFIYTLILPSGQEVLAQVPSHHRHEIGETIGIYLDLNHTIAFV